MKKIANLLLGLSIASSLWLSACQSPQANSGAQDTAQTAERVEPENGPAFENIDAATFRSKMNEENTVILDVRTPGETQEGMIENAIAVDFMQDDFQEKIAGMDRDKTYLVYCQSGGRSSRACELMAEMGFKTLFNLEGGYSGWLK